MMTRKLTLLLLLLLTILQWQPKALIDGLAVTNDASGEAETTTDEPSSTCKASSQLLLNGKLSSCDTFQIATLSSPRRCIHIQAVSSDDDNDSADNDEEIDNNNTSNKNDTTTPKTMFCTDYHNWFDGTNGCHAYTTQNEWCTQYGQITQTQYTANEACCVCGGGLRQNNPRLQVGTYVKVSGYGHFDACPSLQIVKIEVLKQQQYQKEQYPYQQFQYIVQVQKACGPMIVKFVNNVGSLVESYQPGQKFNVSTDDPKIISKRIRVELKKCRSGSKEQEFAITPMGEEVSNENDGKKDYFVVIMHPLTQMDFSMALETSSPFFNVTQVFEDGLFDGSDDYFYLKVRAKNDDGRINWDGTPYDYGYSYLSSGNFGEKEYST